MKMKTILTTLLATVMSAACGGAPQSLEKGPVKVVATTNIVADLVRTIGMDGVEVEALMGPGIDPHLYKASAGDVRRMSTAEAIFYSGLHLEGKMSEILERMGEQGVRTLAVAECAPQGELLESASYSGLHDPHVWFDVALWAKTVGCVAETLADLDPDGALDLWVRERLQSLAPDQRVLVTAHDAFGYFGRAYGVEVRGLLGISTAAEAGTSDVQELADFIVARRIPAVFVETSVPPRYVQALQEAVASRGFEVEIGGSLFSDSLGNPGTPEGTYEGTVRSNVETIVNALSTNPDIDEPSDD